MEKLYERIVHDNVVYVELAGSSSETPPTENISAGSWLHETDTALLKSFDAITGQWVTQIELGGASADTRSMRAVPVIDFPSDERREEPEEEPAEEPIEEPEEPTEPAGSDER